MKLNHENIKFPAGESLRLLRWEDSISNVTLLGANGRVHPYEGAGKMWHCHPETELTLITRGTGTRCVGNSIQRFAAPDVLLIGSYLPHCWIGLEKSSGYAVQFLFEESHPFWKIAETTALQELFKNAQRGLHLSGPALSQVMKLVEVMQKCDALERFASLLKILNTIKNAPANELSPLSETTFSPSSRQTVYGGMKRTIDVILNRFQEELTLAEMLKISGMSKATFARQFIKYTGRSFTQFLNQVRIDYACRQLLDTDISISEIAYQSGFASLSHFNHRFHALLNVSPRDYRLTGTSPTAYRKRNSPHPSPSANVSS